MFKVNSKNITMYEGDYGERLPIRIVQGEILSGDVLKFIIQDYGRKNIIEKVVDVNEESFDFFLTEQETTLLPEGKYLWGLKQYREGLLIDTLTANNTFEVIRGQ